MANIIENAKPEFQKVIAHLEKELHNMRGGRASSGLVESVKVEAYNSTMELKSLASISIPDAKTIQIEPWDKGVVKDVEKALIAAGLGMAPNVAGTVIRLNMPAMTEENRRDAVKMVKEKGEQARIGIRGVREQIRDNILAQEKAKTMGEDERFRLMEDLDKTVADYNKQIDTKVKEKEDELMTI